jgi:uncharacterized lipoprotein
MALSKLYLKMKTIPIVLLLCLITGCSTASKWERQVQKQMHREAMDALRTPNLVKHPEQNHVRAYYWY